MLAFSTAFDDGRDLLSTDFSEVVIKKMRAKHLPDRPGMRWERMDMLALDAEDASFDAVVDKVSSLGEEAGTRQRSCWLT